MLGSKRRRKVASRRLLLEGLEPRAMLAGNVAVSVSGSTLKITGDNHSNAVIVTQLDDGAYAVAGVNDTRINGFDDPPVFITYKKITNIEADLKRGDDIFAVGTDVAGLDAIDQDYGDLVDDASVQVLIDFLADNDLELADGFFLKGNLKVKLNDGIDAFAMIADIGGSVTVDGGKHSDLTVIRNSFIGNDLSILNSTEKGNVGHADLVELTNNFVHDAASIKTGDGQDDVFITDLAVSTLTVETGDHFDEVFIDGVARNFDGDPAKKVTVNTGAWGDFVQMANVFAKDVCVDTGSGNDDLIMNDVGATNDLVVKTGSGDDFLNVGLNSAIGVGANHDVTFDTGSGDDNATLVNLLVGDYLQVLMGDGDDNLIIGGSAHKTLLDGGKGLNLLDIVFNDLGSLKIKNFYFDDLAGDDA